MKNCYLASLFAFALPFAHAGSSVEFSAEASLSAANDLVQAVVYAEATATAPAEVAKRVNGDISEALRVIKSLAGVTVKSGNQQTYPV